MALTIKKMYQGTPTTSAVTVYTVPASTSAIIKEIIVVNTTGTAATITLSVVSSGGTQGATNRILSAKSIPANDLNVFALSTAMATGDFISALQGTASALTITVSGVEIT